MSNSSILDPTLLVLPYALAFFVLALLAWPLYAAYSHVYQINHDKESNRWVNEEEKRTIAMEIQMRAALANESQQQDTKQPTYVHTSQIDNQAVLIIKPVVGKCTASGMTRGEILDWLDIAGGSRTTIGAIVDKSAEELNLTLSKKRQMTQREWILVEASQIRPLIVNGNVRVDAELQQ